MAGHSKWANVKHRKARMDAQKGKIFTKLAREIIVAAREAGADIDTNFRLRLAVQKARENNMPCLLYTSIQRNYRGRWVVLCVAEAKRGKRSPC